MNDLWSPFLFTISHKENAKPAACMPGLSSVMCLCFILLFVAIPRLAMADAFYGNVERFSVYEGLSEGSVYSLANDQTGFLWLGTPNGLLRYDGYEFETYSDVRPNQAPLTPPDASHIFIDSKNRLWIGSWGQGLTVYDNDLTLIGHYRHDANDPMSLGSDLIQVIFEDNDGDIWIGTNGGGLTLFNQSGRRSHKQSFTNFKHDAQVATSLSHDRIWSIAQTPDGILWIATNEGLNRLDKSQPGQFTLFKYNNETDKKNAVVRALKVDKKGQLWIGSKNGVSVFDAGKGQFQRQFSTSRPVNSIQIDSAGGVLVGTTRGFYRWNPFSHQLTVLGDNGATVLLPDNDIRDIFIDSNDILWLGTRSSGLFKIKSTPNAFQTYSHFGPQGQTKPIGRVNVLIQDSRGTIWLGTNNGLMTISPGSSQISRLNTDVIEIDAIVEDQQGTLWIGGFEGLFSLSLNDAALVNPVLVNQNHLLDNISDIDISSLLISANNDLWIGTYHEGLLQYDGTKTVNYRHVQGDGGTIASNAIITLVEDHQGNIWAGTNGSALSRFDYLEKRFTHYHNDQNQAESIGGVVINTIHQTDQNTLWIGLQQSLDKLTLSTGEFEHFSTAKGISSQNIQSITEDSQGYLWLTTGKGISRYDVKRRFFVNFTNKDGFDDNLFLPKAVTKTQEGHLYFGGNKGVTKVMPDRLNFNSRSALTAISKIWIDHQPLKQVSFKSRTSLRLPHNTKDLKFQFTLLDFRDPDKNQYSYRLKGFDERWYPANNARITNYTNLSPGDYTFEVKGRNNKGVWSEDDASIQLNIATPWWELLWVRSLVVILIGLTVFLFYRYRLSTLARQNVELEAKVAHRSADLFNAKKQLIESQKHVALSSLVTGIAHEINTPVGIGVTAISMLQDSIDSLLASHQSKTLKRSEFESKLHGIQSGASLVYNNLMKSADLINTFKKVSVDQMSEQRRVFDLGGYIAEIAASLQTKMTIKSIIIAVDCPEQQRVHSYPGAVVQVITNLILNAYIHAFDDLLEDKIEDNEHDRKIIIRVQAKGEKMSVSVCDNGKGIAMDQQSKIFDPFYTTKRNTGGSGLGLHISYNIVDRLLNGTITCTSAPGNGACFNFDIAANQI